MQRVHSAPLEVAKELESLQRTGFVGERERPENPVTCFPLGERWWRSRRRRLITVILFMKYETNAERRENPHERQRTQPFYTTCREAAPPFGACGHHLSPASGGTIQKGNESFEPGPRSGPLIP